jgi:hypothetical protein
VQNLPKDSPVATYFGGKLITILVAITLQTLSRAGRPTVNRPCMPPPYTRRIDRRVHSTRRGRGMDLPEKLSYILRRSITGVFKFLFTVSTLITL